MKKEQNTASKWQNKPLLMMANCKTDAKKKKTEKISDVNYN